MEMSIWYSVDHVIKKIWMGTDTKCQTNELFHLSCSTEVEFFFFFFMSLYKECFMNYKEKRTTDNTEKRQTVCNHGMYSLLTLKFNIWASCNVSRTTLWSLHHMALEVVGSPRPHCCHHITGLCSSAGHTNIITEHWRQVAWFGES